MSLTKINMKPLIHILIIACVSVFLTGCGDSQKEAAGMDSSGVPSVLPDTLKIKRSKTTYVITGIGTGGTNKVAIINNQVLKLGKEIAPGVVLVDVQPTYVTILAGNTRHLLRPGDMQRKIDKKRR